MAINIDANAEFITENSDSIGSLEDCHELYIINECDNVCTKFKEELQNYPDLTSLILKLRKYILKQQNKIKKLASRLKESCKDSINLIDVSTQTDILSWDHVSSDNSCTDITSQSLAEQVKEAAESALQQTGFVYEETSGLYYDYNTGYYYNAELGLYYDGNTGSYYSYDQKTNNFQFHSQVNSTYSYQDHSIVKDVPPSEAPLTSKRKGFQKERERKKLKTVKPKPTEENECVSDVESLEDGECSDKTDTEEDEEEEEEEEEDEKEEQYKEQDGSPKHENDMNQEAATAWPPCMRMIVTETKLENFKVGTLFIVTYTGGTLGREGDHAVCIPDINISKHHAKFSFNDESGKYFIVDFGSRNGTYLDGKRLSVSKQESEPHEIIHGGVLQIGCTKLLCHIHIGRETCEQCEPGLVQRESSVTVGTAMKASSKDSHKRELKRLKKKFGVDKSESDASDIIKLGYEDKAQIRRNTIGSQNPHEKTQSASVDESIQSENKGFKMLSKMGWSQGQGLGKSNEGKTEPVPLVGQQSKAGLGAADADLLSASCDNITERKANVWKKTQQRYQEIP